MSDQFLFQVTRSQPQISNKQTSNSGHVQQISQNTPTGPLDSSQLSQNAASMLSILLEPLNELQLLSNTLFLSLSPAQSKPPPPPPLSVFLACDKALSDAVNLAFKHQIGQQRIKTLEADILHLEAQWHEVCIELEAGKRELEEMIAEGKERIITWKKPKKVFILP